VRRDSSSTVILCRQGANSIKLLSSVHIWYHYFERLPGQYYSMTCGRLVIATHVTARSYDILLSSSRIFFVTKARNREKNIYWQFDQAEEKTKKKAIELLGALNV
jgi:hypothetical protein